MAKVSTKVLDEDRKFEIEHGVRTAKNFAKLKNDKNLWPDVKKALAKEIKQTKAEFGVG